MRRVKKLFVMALALSVLLMGMPNVMAASAIEEVFGVTANGARTYATLIELGLDFVDGEVVVTCEVEAPSGTTSVDVLYVLREENLAGNLALKDTWSDGSTGASYYDSFTCCSAIEGREYEVSIRVGIYDANGLVGYDYKTVSATY